MKQLFFLLLLFIVIESSTAQNVGIGTPTPNPSALLDITSITKGVLFPRMTTLQRISINTPPNGLMVFDTDRNELYQYISASFSWKALINDSYWRRQILTRNRIGSVNDSVGIGTISPTEWLDVDGNIRTRNNLIADNNVVATGGVSGATISTPGNLTVAGTSFLNNNVTANANLSVDGTSLLTGNVTTNSDLIVNNTTATLQLKSSNINKGFFQLSGDNLRFGTNSGNTTGEVIVRLDGNDRFKFDKNGRFTLFADNTPTLYFNTGGINQAFLQLQGQDLTINATGNKVRISNVLYADDATNRVGIGTSAPEQMLHVVGNTIVTGVLRVGAVSVPSGYKFAIDGKMICEEVRVKLASSGWPDYVFADNYRLPSLDDVEQFIRENKHLPNIPSATEVEKNGIEIGDMQKKMMEKIEQLTLYIIELKKEIDILKKK